jgi:hypothetical protein
MTLAVPTWVGALATVVLAIGAIVTVYYAWKAFREQARELRIQSDQLDAQREQFADQREINEKQTAVLALQSTELEASLAQRKEEAEDQRRAQANRVAAWFGSQPIGLEGRIIQWGAFIGNSSDLPILNVRVFFHFIAADSPASEEWNPIMRGGPPSRIRVLPPQSQRFVEIPESVRNMIDQVGDDIYVVSIEFTDVAGNRWERDPRGALRGR